MEIHKSLSGTVLKAVIIYDDFDSATRATTLLERVASRADAEIKWDIKPWRFEVLKQPVLAALTVAVAANADLVVLALKRTGSTPVQLLDWLKDWAKRRRIEDAALLALASDETEEPASWDEVKAMAKGYGLIFLDRQRAQHNGSSVVLGRNWQRQLVAPGPARAFAGRLPLPPHWGINE